MRKLLFIVLTSVVLLGYDIEVELIGTAYHTKSRSVSADGVQRDWNNAYNLVGVGVSNDSLSSTLSTFVNSYNNRTFLFTINKLYSLWSVKGVSTSLVVGLGYQDGYNIPHIIPNVWFTAKKDNVFIKTTYNQSALLVVSGIYF